VDEKEIRKHAIEAMREHGLSDGAYLSSFREKFVKLVEDRRKPGKVEVRKAWVARFNDDAYYKGAWLEIVLDEDGTVLRVDQSR
jgi:hypothetical protein